jgi:hypothetical protein|tara:strand:- start:7261 stop:8142 length:882 start_codon:yes stop_codon:yes gene_type:complete
MASIEIAMPTTPNFVRSSFRLNRAIGTTVSPFTGQQKTQEYDYVGWSGEVMLPPMRRAVAANWQSWLARLKGSANFFQFTDPDALTNVGTYDGAHLIATPRVNDTSTSLAFAVANGAITSNESIFGSALVGDYIFVAGSAHEQNNGTHKISAVTSATVVQTTSILVAENSTAGRSVQQNVKGATGLSLTAMGNSEAGTIAVGDYLGVLTAASATSTPTQLLLVTEVSTQTAVSGGLNKISVGTQPKLRSAITSGHFVKFASPKGIFRLTDNIVEWQGDKNSNYNLGFSVGEVI